MHGADYAGFPRETRVPCRFMERAAYVWFDFCNLDFGFLRARGHPMHIVCTPGFETRDIRKNAVMVGQ